MSVFQMALCHQNANLMVDGAQVETDKVDETVHWNLAFQRDGDHFKLVLKNDLEGNWSALVKVAARFVLRFGADKDTPSMECRMPAGSKLVIYSGAWNQVADILDEGCHLATLVEVEIDKYTNCIVVLKKCEVHINSEKFYQHCERYSKSNPISSRWTFPGHHLDGAALEVFQDLMYGRNKLNDGNVGEVLDWCKLIESKTCKDLCEDFLLNHSTRDKAWKFTAAKKYGLFRLKIAVIPSLATFSEAASFVQIHEKDLSASEKSLLTKRLLSIHDEFLVMVSGAVVPLAQAVLQQANQQLQVIDPNLKHALMALTNLGLLPTAPPPVPNQVTVPQMPMQQGFAQQFGGLIPMPLINPQQYMSAPLNMQQLHHQFGNLNRLPAPTPALPANSLLAALLQTPNDVVSPNNDQPVNGAPGDGQNGENEEVDEIME